MKLLDSLEIKLFNHTKYGTSDFLETFKKAVQFLFIKLNLNLFWNPKILEAPYIFSEKVFLNIQYHHQVAWTGLKIEFFKRNEQNELVHYDPPKWLFELRSNQGIIANNFLDFIHILFKNSLDNDLQIIANVKLSLKNSNDTYNSDLLIKGSFQGADNFTIVKILDSCSLSDLNNFEHILKETAAGSIILVSKKEFSLEIKKYVSNSCKNIFLVSVGSQDAENLPLGFFKIGFEHSNVEMTALRSSVLGVREKDNDKFTQLQGKKISDIGNNFSFDKVNLLSFKSVCLSHVNPKKNVSSGSTKLTYKPNDKKNIFYKINDEFVKVGLEVDFDWKITNLTIHAPILSFDKAQTGISVWNLETYSNELTFLDKLLFRVIKYGNTSAIGMI